MIFSQSLKCCCIELFSYSSNMFSLLYSNDVNAITSCTFNSLESRFLKIPLLLQKILVNSNRYYYMIENNMIFLKRIEHVIADISNEFIFKTNVIDTRKNIFYIILHMSKKLLLTIQMSRKKLYYLKNYLNMSISYIKIFFWYIYAIYSNHILSIEHLWRIYITHVYEC